jgi:hypothetical protein
MASVNLEHSFACHAKDLWAVISDFGSIARYIPAVAECKVEGDGIGARRTLTLQGGGQVVERLASLEPDTKVLIYEIIDSVLPVRNYRSTMKIAASSEQACELHWSSTFDAKNATDAEAVAAISGIYEMGFAGLDKLFA